MAASKLALLFALYVPLVAQQPNYDLNRTGTITTESILTPASVSPTFGRQGLGLACRYTSDGFVRTLMQVVHSVTISAVSYDALLFGSTGGTLYFYDANSCNHLLWSQAIGVGTGCTGRQGIIGAPAVDQTNGWVFVVNCKSDAFTIYKINLLTGAIITSTAITGQVPGAGSGNMNEIIIMGMLQFQAKFHIQRPPLIIVGGNVMVMFGSNEFEDSSNPWHGWVMSYSESALAQVTIFCSTPNGLGAGIWMSGGAAAVDASNNIYLTTGNGTSDATDFGQSLLKLNSSLVLQDWFEPSAQTDDDKDLGSNRPILIPGSIYVVAGGKSFQIYLLNTADLGHLQGGGGTAPRQQLQTSAGTPSGTTGTFNSVFMNNVLYYSTNLGQIYAFTWNPSTTLFTATPVLSPDNYGYPGAGVSGSCNGSANCILWAQQDSTTVRALNPVNMLEYWSDTNFGPVTPFNVPLVDNGKMFIASVSPNYVAAYALLPSTVTSGLVTVK